MVLAVSPPKWPPKDKHCSLLAEFTAHRVSFPQPHWMQSWLFRNCGNKTKIGLRHSVSHIQQEWNKIYESLTPLSSKPSPRCIRGDENKLFCFTEASAKAYSAAVYLYSTVTGKATVNLVFPKGRVAPARQLSIPRLELLGVLIGRRCLNYVTQQLQLSVVDRILWTNSQHVLQQTTSKPLPVFVQNRLREITSHRDIKFDYGPLHKIQPIWLPEVSQEMNLSTLTCGGIAHRG